MNLTRESLLWSPTRQGVPSSDDGFTPADIIAAGEAMEQEAGEVIPFRFDVCSGDAGYIKQSVYGCLTCLNYAGVCAGCSVKCHGEHQLVELFTRRNFKCDCGTERMGAGSFCSLANRDDAPSNRDNHYSKNFKGEFCVCGVPYDPHTETDAMYQCLVCEDWLHHACLFGTHSDEAKSPLATDDFDMLVCAHCVETNERLRRILDRWAGVEGRGVMVISEKDEVLGRAHLDDEDDDAPGESKVPLVGKGENGEKRKAEGDLESSDEEAEQSSRLAKRPKHVAQLASMAVAAALDSDSDAPGEASSPGALASSISSASTTSTVASSAVAGPSSSAKPAGCSAPPRPPSGTSVLDRLSKQGARLNVYLEEGWMERWCLCAECLVDLNVFPYMLEEEDIYEPPEDPDARSFPLVTRSFIKPPADRKVVAYTEKSTLELGMEALAKLPRGQAIDGVTAFTGLSERLRAYLRPHAEAGETITKAMVDEFFAAERERNTLRS